MPNRFLLLERCQLEGGDFSGVLLGLAMTAQPNLQVIEKKVAKAREEMVDFNNRDIATLQIFKNFIVFIVSHSFDANLILRGNGRQSSRGRIFIRFSSGMTRHLTMKNSNFTKK